MAIKKNFLLVLHTVLLCCAMPIDLPTVIAVGYKVEDNKFCKQFTE